MKAKKNNSKVPVKKSQPACESNFEEGVPTLFLGDIHYGAIVHPEEVQYLNMYSREVAQARLAVAFDSFLEYVAREAAYNQFKTCVVVIPGDAVEGETIVGKLDGIAARNAVELADVLFLQLKKLEAVFSDVAVVCVPGNHGRTEKRQPSDVQTERNYDTVCYHALDSLCRNANSNITVVMSDKTAVQWYQVFDTTYVVTHGEDIPVCGKKDNRRGPEEVRSAGIAYRKQLLEQTLHNHPGELKNPEGLVLLAGHNHCVVDAHKSGFIATGSLRGMDSYAFRHAGWSQERPAAIAWVTRQSRGITSVYEILCDEQEFQSVAEQDNELSAFKTISWKPSPSVAKYYSKKAA